MDQTFNQRIIKVIAATQKIPPEHISLDSSLEELGIDSFDGINLIFALEDEFNIHIPDETKEFKYVRDIVAGMAGFIHSSAKN